MKQAAWPILLVIAAVPVLACLVDVWQGDVRAVAAPPLSLEGYMDEKLPEAPADKPKLKVDNSACYVCHGNYDSEELVVSHGMEEIGCIDCHGPSHAHRDDEDNVTPPDTMYAPEDVDKMCGTCHDMHDAPAQKVIQRWQERCPAKTNPKQIICTDCHYHHRLAFRTVWWDKKTGKLIIRKEGQRTKKAEDLTSADKPASGQPDSEG